MFTLPIFGGVRVFGFGAMIVLAFISATWLAAWRARREKLDPEVILDMAFWVVFFGMVGARLFYCYEYWGQEIKSFWDIIQYWKGGIVFYGGDRRRNDRILRLSCVQAVPVAALHGRDGALDRNRDACSDGSAAS